ncbi:MAG: respiratory nitrate reductase subunit gamma [Gaiellaceae bacterium]
MSRLDHIPFSRSSILFGELATLWGSAVDRYAYRETVSPWFRGIFTLQPHESLMANAPFVFQAHAVSTWLLLAVWPLTRLVHAWNIPLGYLGRAPILYRSRAIGAASRIGVSGRRARRRTPAPY